MSRTYKDSRGKSTREPRRIVARGVKRRPIDYRKLSRALLELAQAQAEKDAAATASQDERGANPEGDPPKAAA